MVRAWRGVRAGAAVALLAAAACATGRQAGGAESQARAGGSEGAQRTVEIRLDNSLIPPVELTVWIVPATGTRRQVAIIPPGTKKVVRLALPQTGVEYQLFAKTLTGYPITSRKFDLADAAGVEWDVGVNSIRVIAASP